jgi:hypothetical protein
MSPTAASTRSIVVVVDSRPRCLPASTFARIFVSVCAAVSALRRRSAAGQQPLQVLAAAAQRAAQLLGGLLRLGAQLLRAAVERLRERAQAGDRPAQLLAVLGDEGVRLAHERAGVAGGAGRLREEVVEAAAVVVEQGADAVDQGRAARHQARQLGVAAGVGLLDARGQRAEGRGGAGHFGHHLVEVDQGQPLDDRPRNERAGRLAAGADLDVALREDSDRGDGDDRVLAHDHRRRAQERVRLAALEEVRSPTGERRPCTWPPSRAGGGEEHASMTPCLEAELADLEGQPRQARGAAGDTPTLASAENSLIPVRPPSRR